MIHVCVNYVFLSIILDFKYIVGLESYGPRSACFEVGERWAKKIRQHKKKEIMIAAQIEWGAGCYEVRYCSYIHHVILVTIQQYKCTKNSIVIIVGNSHFECKKAGKKVRTN